jgi:hypothetical protein
MSFVQSGSLVVLTLLAGGLCVSPAAADGPAKGGGIVRVRPPVSISVPRTDPTTGVRDSIPRTVRGGGGGGGDAASSGTSTVAHGGGTSAADPSAYSMPDGGTLNVTRFSSPLPAPAAEGKAADEMVRYDDGNPNNNYKVVKNENEPSWNSTPWREQNCVGLVLEQKFGIKNAVVPAATFHNDFLVKQNVPEVPQGQVEAGDIGIMFYEDGGGPGHAFYVSKVQNGAITIRSKDQWERTREGVLSEGDDVHKGYRGEIKFYRIDPSTHQLVPKK